MERLINVLRGWAITSTEKQENYSNYSEKLCHGPVEQPKKDIKKPGLSDPGLVFYKGKTSRFALPWSQVSLLRLLPYRSPSTGRKYIAVSPTQFCHWYPIHWPSPSKAGRFSAYP